MEVKPECKQTEVGVIPGDWQLRSMLSTIHVASGQIDPKVEPYRSMILVAPDHIESGSGRLLKKETANEQHAISGKYIFAKGDIVYSKIRPYLRKAILADFDGLCSADMYPLKSASDVSARYIFAAILGHHFSKYAESVSVRSGMPKINRAELAEYTMALPPTKAEQEAIADALSDADALIESLGQLLAKKRLLKQGTMQELLTGKKRLPGFSGEWKETALGQIGKCIRGVSYNPRADLSPFDTDSTIRLLRSNNVQRATVLFEDMQFVISGRVSADQRLRPSDILICMANGSRDLVGKAGRFSADDGFGYTFGAFMGCFRPNGQTTDPDFVFSLFQTAAYRVHIAILLAGSSINNLTPGSVEAFVIRVPLNKAEQSAIAAILSDMAAEITALESRLAKARNLKQGMMQELLTGRIRLPVHEREPKEIDLNHYSRFVNR